MILDCSNLDRATLSLPLVKGCDVVRNGALRMVTPFSYPNGDRIDVFLHHRENLIRNLYLSDYGQTAMYLRGAQIDISATASKRTLRDGVLSQLNVGHKNGELFINLVDREADPSDLSDAIFRLGQACLRLSDFAAHQRLRTANPFRDDVEGFLEESGLSYIPDQTVRGQFNNEVKVDFEVFGTTSKSYVAVLASLDTSAAHTSSNETFRKWYDISETNPDHSLITVYNSRLSVLKEIDKKRLGKLSTVISYPEENKLLQKAVAA